MNTAALVHKLELQQVRLTADGDRIEIDGPEDAVTDAVIDKLRERKPELLKYLHLSGILKKAGIEASGEGWIVTIDELQKALSEDDLLDSQLMTLKGLEALAHVVRATRMRAQGEIPPEWTSITSCRHCGPVPIWEGCPPDIQGCPWCFNRLAGQPIPSINYDLSEE